LLVAAYFSLGKVTKKYGREDVTRVFEKEHGGGLPGYVAPLIFEHWTMSPIGSPTASPNCEVTRYYYVWFFGYVWRTPYVRVKQFTFNGAITFQDAAEKTSWASWRY
jgi:hypothetical protein